MRLLVLKIAKSYFYHYFYRIINRVIVFICQIMYKFEKTLDFLAIWI